MTTTREIITRAMRRIRIVDAMQQPSAEDADLVLDALNDMMQAWQWDGVPIEHTDLTLTDTFYFFVPPLLLADDVLADLAYQVHGTPTRTRRRWDRARERRATGIGSRRLAARRLTLIVRGQSMTLSCLATTPTRGANRRPRCRGAMRRV